MKFLNILGKIILGVVAGVAVMIGLLYLLTIGEYPVAKTVAQDPSLPHVTIDGFTYHAQTFGNPKNPVVIAIHGGPGGDYRSILSLQALSDQYFVVFYDQRSSGLSPRVDPEEITGKAKIFAEWEDRLTIFDTLILCRFYRDLYQWEQLSTILKSTTGLDLDVQAMRIIAASVSDDTRRFNLREGLTTKDDLLPKRFHNEVLPESEALITEKQMEQMLKEYYAIRGWNEDGKIKE